MQKTVLLFFALLFGLIAPVKAQLTFFTDEYVENQGEMIQIPIKVKNFTDILTIQYTFEWDETVLKYISTEEPLLNEWNIVTYNPTTANEGFVRFIFLDLAIEGKTLADNEAILRLNFEVIGNPGDSTLLSFPDSPLPAEYSTVGDTVNQQPITETGKLKVFMDVGTDKQPADFGWEISNCTPNPISDRGVVTFSTPQFSEVQWSIFDTTGKLITTRYKAYPAGVNHFVLEQHLLKSNGTYFLKLETPDFVHTQKIEFFR